MCGVDVCCDWRGILWAPGIYDVYQLHVTSEACRVIRQAGVVHRHLECLARGVEDIYQWLL